LRVFTLSGRAVANIRQKNHAKTIAWKSRPDQSLTGDKWLQKTLRELAALTAQFVHLIDFI